MDHSVIFLLRFFILFLPLVSNGDSLSWNQVMRRYAVEEPYEKLKAVTRDRKVSKEVLHQLIEGLEIPHEAKKSLLELTPETYIGAAKTLARNIWNSSANL